MLSPFLSVPRSCDETTTWVARQLSQTDLRVMQTFDLHDARLGVEDCPCPHHGTEQCDCQMVVLLVYGDSPRPLTLILHGNDGQTWVSFADRVDQQTEAGMAAAIENALQLGLSQIGSS